MLGTVVLVAVVVAYLATLGHLGRPRGTRLRPMDWRARDLVSAVRAGLSRLPEVGERQRHLRDRYLDGLGPR